MPRRTNKPNRTHNQKKKLLNYYLFNKKCNNKSARNEINEMHRVQCRYIFYFIFFPTPARHIHNITFCYFLHVYFFVCGPVNKMALLAMMMMIIIIIVIIYCCVCCPAATTETRVVVFVALYILLF